MADIDKSALLAMTTGIIANFVANNRVSPDELPGLVTMVHASLSGLGESASPEAEEFEKPTAAQIRKSVTDDGIVSFLNGKRYQSLRRHLTRNGMTPEGYRGRYSLPADYPMTAPAYSARRSELAKAIGLGRGGRQPKIAETVAKQARKARAPKS